MVSEIAGKPIVLQCPAFEVRRFSGDSEVSEAVCFVLAFVLQF